MLFSLMFFGLLCSTSAQLPVTDLDACVWTDNETCIIDKSTIIKNSRYRFRNCNDNFCDIPKYVQAGLVASIEAGCANSTSESDCSVANNNALKNIKDTVDEIFRRRAIESFSFRLR